MKKRTKLMLGGVALAAGVLVLSSCTQSFCSDADKGRMMYAFDPGVTRYEINGGETIVATYEDDITHVTYTYTIDNVSLIYASWDSAESKFIFGNGDELTYLNSIISDASNAGLLAPNGNTFDYFKKMDEFVLTSALESALAEAKTDITRNLAPSETDANGEAIAPDDYYKFERDLSYYSYLKFYRVGESFWENWDSTNALLEAEFTQDQCLGTDFITYYKSKMNSYVSSYRTCLTTKTDKYGSYGYQTNGVYIDGKTWGEAWNRGFFEGLLVYPIGWLIDQIGFGFRGLGVDSGWAALLAILFVTLIIRGLMLLATIKQTANNAKMTELQPEITKIQNKYPNANTSQSEKQRMAEEMNRLYKKNKINPFSAILVMIIQFPVFICVWGALSGSAILSSGKVLGLDLSLTIREVLMTQSNWWPQADGFRPAVTALFLFIAMALAQAASMLLPQIMQKIRAKKVASLGKNPAQNSQANKMKWFTYIMLAMIIFMGFSLVSAMGVYWLVGALISLVQTVIMQVIADKRKKKKK